MDHLESLQRQNKMLSYLSGLPKKMVSLHGADNVSELVLHDLCHERCFNLNKAAFFVDNPDFNCTKGVAGFCRTEPFSDYDIMWKNPHVFNDYMKQCRFNQQVRTMNRCSLRKDQNRQMLAESLAKDLGFTNHTYCSWPMKNDNEGFIVYEKIDPTDTLADEYLESGLSLLSFCPIF